MRAKRHRICMSRYSFGTQPIPNPAWGGRQFHERVAVNLASRALTQDSWHWATLSRPDIQARRETKLRDIAHLTPLGVTASCSVRYILLDGRRAPSQLPLR
jgi:hypothetical protein